MSTLMTIIQTVVAEIRLLGLDGVADAAVVSAPTWESVEEIEPGLPGVLVLPGKKVRPDPAGGTNLQSDVVYPIRVVLLDAEPSEGPIDLATQLDRAEAVRTHFHRNPPAGPSGVLTCRVPVSERLDEARLRRRRLSALQLEMEFVVPRVTSCTNSTRASGRVQGISNHTPTPFPRRVRLRTFFNTPLPLMDGAKRNRKPEASAREKPAKDPIRSDLGFGVDVLGVLSRA